MPRQLCCGVRRRSLTYICFGYLRSEAFWTSRWIFSESAIYITAIDKRLYRERSMSISDKEG
jgi:hypothetical protein